MLYKYSAKTMTSKVVRGKKEADSIQDLTRYLRSQDMYLVKAKEVVKNESTYKLKLTELTDLCRELGTMIASGVSLISAMNIVTRREVKVKLREIYKDIYIKLQQGYSFSNALASQKGAFPLLMVNMIRASESSGLMDETLNKLAKQYEKENRINGKVKSAMLYPTILAIVTVGVIIIIFSFVMPSFLDTFDGMEMPVITQVMFKISNVFTNYWYLLLIFILVVIALVSFLLRLKPIRLKFDEFKLKIPKAGKLLSIIYTARFARSMSSLYTSGVAMINSLTLARSTVNNTYIEAQFDEVIKLVRDGSSLSNAIGSVKGFDSKLATYIYIGEESGRLDEMLENVANDFDFESEMAIEKMITLLQPLMIIILGIIICLVVIGVILPIYSLYGNVSGKG